MAEFCELPNSHKTKILETLPNIIFNISVQGLTNLKQNKNGIINDLFYYYLAYLSVFDPREIHVILDGGLGYLL